MSALLVDALRYSSLPTTLLTAAGVERRHWEQIRTGWLVQTSRH